MKYYTTLAGCLVQRPWRVLFYKLVWPSVQCFPEKSKALAKTSSLNMGVLFWIFIYVLRLLDSC